MTISERTATMNVIVSEQYGGEAGRWAARFFQVNLTMKHGTTTTYLSRIPVSLN